MARQPRIVVPNLPLHVMHRGNNRQDVFENHADMYRIKKDIRKSLEKSACSLHAYVIMSNHLHLLVTPPARESIAIFMQSMANRYVRYFNSKRGRSGTIWEGRYKSCLVDSDNYLFAVYRYIEMNPLRAGIVTNLGDFRWSSYHHNVCGKVDDMLTEHELYMDLGGDVQTRCTNYQALFNAPQLEGMDKKITSSTIRGEVLGGESFHSEISKLILRPTKLSSHGGDRKGQLYRYQAG